MSPIGTSLRSRHRSILVANGAYRHDEPGLASEVKTVEIVSFRFKDHLVKTVLLIVAFVAGTLAFKQVWVERRSPGDEVDVCGACCCLLDHNGNCKL
jgi:hypothetical protein